MGKTKVTKQVVIERTKKYVKSELEGQGKGHDWWHILRVRNNAMQIASKEKGTDVFIVELSALLHDIADWKFQGGNEKAGSKAAQKWLKSQDVDSDTMKEICKIIDTISFKGAGVKVVPSTLEGKIVQDADRLDAIGAIGIARAFTYGGEIEREIYNPEIKPSVHKSSKSYKKESYKGTKATTINHFYEKMLLLKDRMNTNTAREIAEERHKYMEGFLKRFYEEWNGKL
jgi:uncharacterized protein